MTREPQQGLRRHKLLPAEVVKSLPPLYAQDGKGMEAIVHLKLFCPYNGRAAWYITEGSATLDDGRQIGLADLDDVSPEHVSDITFFGYCVSPHGPGEDEFGYASFNELAASTVFGKVPAIERDCHYNGIGKTVRECLGLR